LRALGVRELAALLAGEISHEEARDAILKQTIAYQKRQRTWARGRQAGWTLLHPNDTVAIEALAEISAEAR